MAIQYHPIDPDGDVLLLLQSSSSPPTSPDGPRRSRRSYSRRAVSRQLENSTITSPENLISGNSVQMLVSSKHLMSASSVFKAMLRADAFQEGQTLNSTGKVSIPLPDDNPEAMKVLLDILHHRNRQVPKTVTLSLMTHLTILVDKYQMIEVLDAYHPIWLADGTSIKTTIPTTFRSRFFFPWLAISWVFQLRQEFLSMTKLALQESERVLSNLTYEGHDLPIPSSVIENIESRRQDMIATVVLRLGEQIQKYHGPEVHCKYAFRKEMMAACDAFQLGSLIRAASAIGIWPSPAPPYNGLNWQSLSAKLRDMNCTSLCESPFSRSVSDIKHGVMPEILQQVSDLDTLMNGLPLEFQS